MYALVETSEADDNFEDSPLLLPRPLNFFERPPFRYRHHTVGENPRCTEGTPYSQNVGPAPIICTSVRNVSDTKKIAAQLTPAATPSAPRRIF